MGTRRFRDCLILGLVLVLGYQNCSEFGDPFKKKLDSSGGPIGSLHLVGEELSLPPGGLQKVAFDPLNRIYLSVTGDPTRGQFLNSDGSALGGVFTIGSEGSYNAWSNVAYGGTGTDPVFLVTYAAVEGSSHVKYGRLVRYSQAGAQVSGRFLISDISGCWYASERAHTIWHKDRFIVGLWKHIGGTQPGPVLYSVFPDGTVSAGSILGSGDQYQSLPALACSPSGTCLAIGYVNTGNSGGTWARRFNFETLSPVGSLFYLALTNDGSMIDEQQVLYDTRTGKFLVAWGRQSDGGWIDFLKVRVDGSVDPIDYSRSLGPGAGDISLTYNAGSDSALLVTKLGGASDLYALQIGHDGYPNTDPILVTYWDGLSLAYWNSAAANPTGNQWLVTYALGSGTKYRLIQWSP